MHQRTGSWLEVMSPTSQKLNMERWLFCRVKITVYVLMVKSKISRPSPRGNGRRECAVRLQRGHDGWGGGSPGTQKNRGREKNSHRKRIPKKIPGLRPEAKWPGGGRRPTLKGSLVGTSLKSLEKDSQANIARLAPEDRGPPFIEGPTSLERRVVGSSNGGVILLPR